MNTLEPYCKATFRWSTDLVQAPREVWNVLLFGAGTRNRTEIFSLEGCNNKPLYDTRIVLGSSDITHRH